MTDSHVQMVEQDAPIYVPVDLRIYYDEFKNPAESVPGQETQVEAMNEEPYKLPYVDPDLLKPY